MKCKLIRNNGYGEIIEIECFVRGGNPVFEIIFNYHPEKHNKTFELNDGKIHSNLETSFVRINNTKFQFDFAPQSKEFTVDGTVELNGKMFKDKFNLIICDW
jgi:hypothetical protein